MPGINMMPSGSTLQIPLDAPAGFTAKAGNAQVTLTWTDPKDKYATPEGETAQDPDQLVSVWEYTQIIRKTGSQPTGPHDGELVVSSSVRDQYATTGFVDDGLTNDTLYYYAAYAYNTDGVASEGAFTSATPIAGTPLSQLAEGTLIKILENGAPVEFYLAKHSYEPTLNGEGRELVVRKDCLPARAWGNNVKNGNRYANSLIFNWGNNDYFNQLSDYTKNAITGTNIKYIVGGGDDSVATLNTKIFILSGGEFESFFNDGEVLPTASILRIAYYNGRQCYQWTRTPINYIDNVDVHVLDREGEVTSANCGNSGSYYPRPCFTLSNTAFVDQDLNLIET